MKKMYIFCPLLSNFGQMITKFHLLAKVRSDSKFLRNREQTKMIIQNKLRKELF